MTIAYLVNQYPQVSHTFIRREIAALERLGMRVERFSIRQTSGFVDPQDEAEFSRTRAVLAGGFSRLGVVMLASAVRTPLRFARALGVALRLGGRSPTGRMRHLVYLMEGCLMARWLRAIEASHLHAHFGTNSASVALLAHVLADVPYSFTVHGPEEFDRPEALSLGEKIEAASFVVAVSEFGRAQLCRWCAPASWSKLHVIRCGLDSQFLNGGDDAPATQPAERNDPVQAPPTFVCVGRLCEQKGQLLLIEAAHRLRNAGRSFKLVLVGDGEMRSDVEAMVRRCELTDAVTITGWVSCDRVASYLSECYVMVLPSFAEGLPVAIMEAFALGRPVISTYVAGIPELVTPECGWLVPAGSIDALVGAMTAALDADPASVAAMGRTGRERVAARHDAVQEARRLAALFDEHGAGALPGRIKRSLDLSGPRRAGPASATHGT